MEQLGWPLLPSLANRARQAEATGGTVVYVGWAGRVRGTLLLSDALRSEARATITQLQRLGLPAILLTGDLPVAAQQAAAACGMQAYHAGLAPQDKQALLARYTRTHGAIAMVGDGLNDGPVLASAAVGIAVGTATDLARETADVVLPRDGLTRLPWLVELARRTQRTILTNLAFAFGYNLIALAAAVAGLLQPVLAAGLMAGSSLLIVLRSLRLDRLHDEHVSVPPRLGAPPQTAPVALCASKIVPGNLVEPMGSNHP
jgi:Cu2+-exporting ATPase